jgi:hypothetical protein
VICLRGGSEFAENVFNLPIDTPGYALLLVNVAIVFIGIAIAFVRHDAHPYYEPSERELARAKRRLRSLESRYERKRDKKGRRFDEQIAQHDRELEAIEADIETLAHRIEGACSRRDQNIDLVCKTLYSRLLNYQKGNQATRAERTVPECFQSTSEKTVRTMLLDSAVESRGDVVTMGDRRSS